MKSILKLEEIGMFVLGVFMFMELNYSWWWFFTLILMPDIGMLGYLINNRVGAIFYNSFHHKGLSILTFLIGTYFEIDSLKLLGIILFAHSSMDRIFGYGLKYKDSFKNTHLGQIGKN